MASTRRHQASTIARIAISWTCLLLLSHLDTYLFVQDLVALGKLSGSYTLFPDLAGVAVLGLVGGTLGATLLVKSNARLDRHEGYLVGIARATGVFVTFFVVAAALLLFALAFLGEAVKPTGSGLFASGWRNIRVNLITPSFLSTMVLWGGLAAVTQFLLQVSRKFGSGVLWKMLTGRYHSPREEERIFMFLDLRASTEAAEQLGPRRYFEFLRDVFRDATRPIVECQGEIYQYVGDEIVVTWTPETGLAGANCVRCFYSVEAVLGQAARSYAARYGVSPSFKAGLHVGKVTVGEIGVVKKDIVFSGDAVNTTARIQAECNRHRASLLASEKLVERLAPQDDYHAVPIGSIPLRGKADPLSLCLLLPA